jgi:putative ABC transport system permease protein
MWKYRTPSLIGVFGLAFGLACFVTALYWLRYETMYDSFYPDAKHIYRIYAVEKQSGKINEWVPPILERMLHEQFPEVEVSAGFVIWPEKCSAEGIPYMRLNTMYADSAFFDVFPQVFVSGDARQPLQVLNDIVITETLAVRLFGDVDKAIGQHIQSIMIPNWPPYTITAVVKDAPPNTNVPFDAIIFHDVIKGLKSIPEEESWSYFQLQTYVKLHPLTDVNELAEQLLDFPSRSYTNANFEVRIMPIGDIRHQLNADASFTLNFVRLFIAAGILLLFSAVFNFLNLHLDLFHQRIRELRLRTVHGATGGQLVGQMLFELTCAILPALLFASGLILLARPSFSGLLGIEMGIMELIRLFAVCAAGVMALMLPIGLIFFGRLSRLALRPRSEIKTTGQPVLRRMAVTLQLAVSIILIVAALVVMIQMRYVDRKDLGFDRNGIIQLSEIMDYSRGRNVWTALKHELEAIPQIENFTQTCFEPKHSAQHNVAYPEILTELEWSGKSLYEKPAFHTINVDSRFAETFGLKMLMGGWFDESGTHKIVLNEEAVRVMGLSEPVGTTIRLHPENNLTVPIEDYEIAGVVKDFHTLSLRSRILPTIFFPFTETYLYTTYIRVVPGQDQETIRQIKAILPDIDVSMADVSLMPLGELYDHFNRSEQVGLKLFSVLATVCLMISLFGIYAIATASTQCRRKEVAIRKVMGAEAGDVVRLFFREHTMQVIMAGVIALPVAYYAMLHWLQGYAYRTNIPWWLLAGVITGVIAVVLLTVFGQVLKAANQNPAEAVKNE